MYSLEEKLPSVKIALLELLRWRSTVTTGRRRSGRFADPGAGPEREINLLLFMVSEG
jgi:hypothetical protein